MIIFHWIILKTINVSGKICTESRNAQFTFNKLFPKIVPFMRYCGKMCWSERPQMITRRMRFACCITKATETRLEYVIIILLPIATMVTRTRLNVTFIQTLPALLNKLRRQHISEQKTRFWNARYKPDSLCSQLMKLRYSKHFNYLLGCTKWRNIDPDSHGVTFNWAPFWQPITATSNFVGLSGFTRFFVSATSCQPTRDFTKTLLLLLVPKIVVCTRLV